MKKVCSKITAVLLVVTILTSLLGGLTAYANPDDTYNTSDYTSEEEPIAVFDETLNDNDFGIDMLAVSSNFSPIAQIVVRDNAVIMLNSGYFPGTILAVAVYGGGGNELIDIEFRTFPMDIALTVPINIPAHATTIKVMI